MNTVQRLTPAGTGAIATLQLTGDSAWPLVRKLFRPAGSRPLPERPEAGQLWFGTIAAPESLESLGTAGDEVVLAVPTAEPVPVIEVHCHGGVTVVRWLLAQFSAAGFQEVNEPGAVLRQSFPYRHQDLLAAGQLPVAKTGRSASLLLAQAQGAFRQKLSEAVTAIDAGDSGLAGGILNRLVDLIPVGLHLSEPWRVTVAGPPNVGKSSLMNAVAGYERAIVAPVPGTTRDVVRTMVALNGWPVQLADTAGIRETDEELERAGITLTEASLAASDLVLWLVDLSSPEPAFPIKPVAVPMLIVGNKSDAALPANRDLIDRLDWTISAATGEGVPGLLSLVVSRLIPAEPLDGEALPYTPELAEATVFARESLQREDWSGAKATLNTLISRTANTP